MDYPVEYLLELREAKDDEFKNSPYSPLTPQQQQHFDGLRYFDPNPALEFTLLPLEYENKDPIRILTSKNEIRSYMRWGQIRFEVDGEEATLTLYKAPGRSEFFVPFADATNGTETYGAGRYLDLETQPDGRLLVDFNVAYNPYCAYNEQWSCPLVPAENRLAAAIRAGEKSPEGPWLEHTGD